MKKIFKNIIFAIIVLLFFQTKTISDEFYFEGDEIQILNEGKKLISNKGVKITSNSNINLTSNKFEYDKEKMELKLKEDVFIEDLEKNLKIKAQEIYYFKKDEIIVTNGFTEINIDNKFTIKSEDITFEKNFGRLSSNQKSFITDEAGNILESESFKFQLKDETIKAKNVVLRDNEGNTSFLENFMGNMNSKVFYGKDIKINFDKKIFGNKNNDPRLYGNSIQSDQNYSKISKGVFTTCKKNDSCPPWKIQAEEVVHDKKKKIINYKNAWLQIYDKPVIYFPKFFHPDPTVNRQSGFLIPNISDSGNTGTSVSTPYYKVLAINKDITFKPRIFANQNLLIQNEFRQVEKNLNHIMDFGVFTSELSNENEPTKSHFFSNTLIKFENKFFETSNLEINFEQVSNDTYLKKFKPSSELIKNENLMHSFLKFNAYEDLSSLSLSLESYEDLSKTSNDRYEFIYPNLEYTKEFFNEKIPGSFDLSSSLYQKHYETNKYKQNLTTDLTYSSDVRIFDKGLVEDFKILLKNPNTILKTGSSNESNTQSKLLTKVMYSLSYPLKKEGLLYNSFLKPNISLRYSPNNTKNISKEDRMLKSNNINSFNRLSMDDGVEGGQSLTTGLDYKLKNQEGIDKISFYVAQVYRDEANPDLPINSSLNNKYSDIIGNIKFNLFNNLNFEYDFMLDNNFEKMNYNLLDAKLSVNNFVTSFQYLEEDDNIGSKSYLKNQTKYSFDKNNSLSFATRRNRELNMTEFYNLIYQYENDCLKAAIEYNKNFYNDSDIKPEEELFFTLTIVPFSKISSTNINQ